MVTNNRAYQECEEAESQLKETISLSNAVDVHVLPLHRGPSYHPRSHYLK
jgi:hypothetical protein